MDLHSGESGSEYLLTCLEDVSLARVMTERARARIRRERELVTDYLDDGGRAYGFTTFFGHLDNQDIRPEDTVSVLNAHLVGAPERLTQRQSTAITLVKLSQLSCGGSGVSIKAFDKVNDSLGTRIEMDVHASYGSGDVVPGAWWVRSIFGAEPDIERGDLIALINGSFVPVGLLLSEVAELQALFSQTVKGVARAQGMVRHRCEKGVQLPVSLRDLDPLEAEISQGTAQLNAAIASSATRCSANPMFLFHESKERSACVSDASNSSFLNFEVLAAVRRIGMSMTVASSYALAAINHAGRIRETESEDNYGVDWVQVPKVATAYFNALEDKLTFSGAFAQRTSEGVEDISDFLLAEVLKIQDAMELMTKLNALLDRCVDEA